MRSPRSRSSAVLSAEFMPNTRHTSGALLPSNEDRRAECSRVAVHVFWTASQGGSSGW